MKITLYDPATGIIDGTVEYPMLEHVDDDWNGDLYWIKDGEAVERPILPPPSATVIPADGSDIVKLEGVPKRTQVDIVFMDVPKTNARRDVFSGTTDDETIEFAAAIRGRYQVTLQPPHPWRPLQFDVTVT